MTFVLFGTDGCHLCDIAAQLVVVAAEGIEVTIYQEDIAESDLLVERYGTRIPVILNELTEQELNWPFSAEQAREFLLNDNKRN
jgi:hypothetical protein